MTIFPKALPEGDKTTVEKIKLIDQLGEEDKNVIHRMIDTILTKRKFQDFFERILLTNNLHQPNQKL